MQPLFLILEINIGIRESILYNFPTNLIASIWTFSALLLMAFSNKPMASWSSNCLMGSSSAAIAADLTIVFCDQEIVSKIYLSLLIHLTKWKNMENGKHWRVQSVGPAG